MSMAHIHRMQALVSMQFPWHYGFGLGLFSPIASPSSMTQDYSVHKPCPWPVAIQVLDSYKLCTIYMHDSYNVPGLASAIELCIIIAWLWTHTMS